MYFPTLPAVLFSLQVLIWLHVILILISDKRFSDHLLYLVTFGFSLYVATVKKHYNEIQISFLANDLHLSFALS